jgi:hypothetical protein
MDMTFRQLTAEIQKLKPKQREKLLEILAQPEQKEHWRGGPDDPFSKFIGKFHGSKSGSLACKEDLYGGDRPL